MFTVLVRRPCSDLVEGGEEADLLAGEAVTSLDGGDGAFHVSRHQQLRQLQQTVAEYEELQREEGSRDHCLYYYVTLLGGEVKPAVYTDAAEILGHLTSGVF